MGRVRADGTPVDERITSIELSNENELLFRPTLNEVVYIDDEGNEWIIANSKEQLKELYQALGTALELGWLSKPEGVGED